MLKKKAQSLSEYSICLAVVLVTLITINVYVKRGLQGRYRDVTDATISAVSAKAGKTVGRQYEPYYVTAETTINMPRHIGTTMDRGGVTKNLLATLTTVKGHNIEGANPD